MLFRSLGTAVDVITTTDRRRHQQDSLAAALGGVPGAPLSSSGATGATASLFLRGANSNQALFLVDGIRFSDANADYNVFLGSAALGAGDTIEIVRGPQSTLYGGEAIGGVVAISAGPSDGLRERSVVTEAGSFGTIRGSGASHRRSRTCSNRSISRLPRAPTGRPHPSGGEGPHDGNRASAPHPMVAQLRGDGGDILARRAPRGIQPTSGVRPASRLQGHTTP